MAFATTAVRSSGANGLSRVHLLVVCVFHVFAPIVKAIPLPFGGFHTFDEDLPKSPEDASLWIYLGIALVLVLGGGVFAGLTIA
jgi:metal transporter CNNM